jgi:hypothetical protein
MRPPSANGFGVEGEAGQDGGLVSVKRGRMGTASTFRRGMEGENGGRRGRGPEPGHPPRGYLLIFPGKRPRGSSPGTLTLTRGFPAGIAPLMKRPSLHPISALRGLWPALEGETTIKRAQGRPRAGSD